MSSPSRLSRVIVAGAMVFLFANLAAAAEPKANSSKRPTSVETAKNPCRTAEECEEEKGQDYSSVVDQLRANLAKLTPGCPECRAAWLLGQESACSSYYKKLYQGRGKNGEVEMKVTFGYGDEEYIRPGEENNSVIDDYYMSVELKKKLKRKCLPGEVGACGFEETRDEDVFTKKVKDPDGDWKTVNLRITSSSYNRFDHENRKVPATQTVNMKNYSLEAAAIKEQVELSNWAKKQFMDGLCGDTSVNIAVAHGRNCAGLDFAPAKRVWGVDQKGARSLNIDYGSYQNNPNYSSKRDMLDALNKCGQRPERPNEQRPELLVLLACNAQKCFGAELANISNVVMVLPPQASYFDVAVGQAWASLNSVLSLQCQNDFEQGLNKVRDRDGKPTPRTELSNSHLIKQ